MIPVILGGVAAVAGGKKAYSYFKKRSQEKAEQRAREEAERKAEEERIEAERKAELARIAAEMKALAEKKEREEKAAIRKDVVHEMEKEQREKYNMAMMIAAASGVKPANPEEDGFVPNLNEDDIEYEVNKRYQASQEEKAKESKINNLMESMRDEVLKSRKECKNLNEQLEEARRELDHAKALANNAASAAAAANNRASDAEYELRKLNGDYYW